MCPPLLVLIVLVLLKANEKRALGPGYWVLAALGTGSNLFLLVLAAVNHFKVTEDDKERALICVGTCVASLLWVVVASAWGSQRQTQASGLDPAERLQAHRRILGFCKTALVVAFLAPLVIPMLDFLRMSSGAAEEAKCVHQLKALAGTLAEGQPVGTGFEINPALSDPQARTAATATSNLVPWAWDGKPHPPENGMNNFPSSRHILYLDGHVERMKETDFQALKK